MMNPSFEDETPVNPFDFWEGANFKMKIRKVDGFSNYDKSEFDNPAPLLEDDDKMEEIWKTQHSLQEFLAPEHFKSYNDYCICNSIKTIESVSDLKDFFQKALND